MDGPFNVSYIDLSEMIHAHNASESLSVYHSFVERQVHSDITVFIGALGILGNMAVIAAVLAVKKLQTTTNVFVLNLAVADVLTCVLLPWQAVAILNDELVFPLWACRVVAFCLLACIGCSINSLACISVNRLVGITTKRQSVFRQLYTPVKVCLMLALTWCVPVAVAVIPFMSDYAEYGYNPLYSTCVWHSNRSYSLTYAMLVAIVFFPVQFAILLLSYVYIFLYVRNTTRSTLRLHNSGYTNVGHGSFTKVPCVGNPAFQNHLWKCQVAVTKNLFLVVFAFLLFILPCFLVLGLPGFAKEYLGYAGTILMANSCVNPIMYATKHPDFRVVFTRILCCERKTAQTRRQSFIPNNKDNGKKASISSRSTAV